VNTEIPENESDIPEAPPEETVIEETKAEETVIEETKAEETVIEETKAEETLKEETKSEESQPRRSGGAFSLFAFLFSVAALALAAWMWWQDLASTGQEEQRVFAEIARLESSDSELSLKLNQLRDEINSLAAGDAGAEFEAMQRRLEADRSKMDNVEQAISEQLALSRSLQAVAHSIQGRMAAAEAAVTGMSTRELDAGSELDIAEVDYLLRLANERLKLFSDPVAAEQALEVADMHLAALESPMYLGVRQEIAAARRELAAVKMPDYLEIANQLDSIQEEIASLPFSVQDPIAEQSAEPEGDGWWEKVKSVFSNLVTVRRSTDEENKRISLQDKDYIRQRVWLQLEIAHLSLMQRDQEAFRSSLERVQESLSNWFDSGDSAYQTIEQGIEDLAALEIQVDVPDVTTPWSTLRLLRASQSRPTPAPAPEPEPDLQPQIPEKDPEAEAEGE